MKGLMKGALALTLVACLAVFFGMPFLAVNNLVAAAKSGDEAALERLVDFPAFRESLKDELTARLMTEVRADPEVRDNPLGGLGMMLAPMLVGGAVDTLVNAPTIAAMVRTAHAPDPTDAEPGPDTGARPADDRADDIRQGYAYRDLNTFVLSLTDPDTPDQTLKLLLRRDGLFGWKLAGVDLPDA